MIPRVIHYCWFGHNPLPKLAQKCINSWRLFFPDYEIKEWNEDNFDVNSIPYTREAYAAKKFAFVSDYARFWILFKYGGIYFDTDVEVVKRMDDVLERGAFMGIEAVSNNELYVNPGLGMAAYPGMSIIKELLDQYYYSSFINTDGTLNLTTIVIRTTKLLKSKGLANNELQFVCGFWVYPHDFFDPMNELTGVVKLTKNTRSIHWYSNSWSDSSRFHIWLSRVSHRLFGLRLHNLFKK